MKEIELEFNGVITKLVSDTNDMFNLNVLHRVSNTPQSKKPSEWIRWEPTRQFLAEFVEAGQPATKSTRGRGAGTWGIEQVVYAYASWISPE